ncbi:hypothetical protein [Rhizobium oryzicola]|uniref:Integrase n=1 Tax=Rhizobium oryzicola TaxID=1232668 RepID=A0ABT8SUJ8_9HYPH|nr:hypothetical protein [Rhizobium oryzicola]MDO1581960.1 hypothetical protein [Rhizobium oryzicola]
MRHSIYIAMRRLKALHYDEKLAVLSLHYRSGRIRQLKDVTPVMAMRLMAFLRRIHSGYLALICSLI